MEHKRPLEVLAPAGSFESMKAAVAAGADAVYMGGTRFGARAYAANPDAHGMIEAIDYTHLHGYRLYMTVNTLFKEEEMGELYDYLLPYYREGLDAVIVQDLGAMAFIRRNFPGLDIHASTQMTVTCLLYTSPAGRHGLCLPLRAGEPCAAGGQAAREEQVRPLRQLAGVGRRAGMPEGREHPHRLGGHGRRGPLGSGPGDFPAPVWLPESQRGH